MRIIAGTAKGRRLAAVPGRDTRSLTDRVKESLFSILTPVLGDARVLDLYAGCGAFGIESVSRGAARAVCVEKARTAYEVCRKNVETVGFTGNISVVRADVVPWCSAAAGGEKFDVIFADPPFLDLTDSRSPFHRLLSFLAPLCTKDGTVIIRTHEHAKAPEIVGMELKRSKVIGLSQLLFYEFPGAPE
jgi:16S rRNA (guanine(966)-N(2))-methyltransferase RsmD